MVLLVVIVIDLAIFARLFLAQPEATLRGQQTIEYTFHYRRAHKN